MKERKIIVVAAMSLAVLFLAVNTTLADPNPVLKSTGVSASPHNLNISLGVGTVTNDEVCRPCHTPHNAQAGQDDLWNHDINPSAAYSLYNTGNDVKFPANYVGLDDASKLCLSCHDGAIAIDSFGGQTGTNFMTGDHAVGLNGDLTDDHPVGVKYPGLSDDGLTWTAVGGYADPTDSAVFNGDGYGTSTGVQLMKLTGGGKVLVGCRSCHHSHGNHGGAFLRTSMQYSFLCLKCHTK